VRLWEAHFGKTFHPASLGRLLKQLGFSRQKARPSHPQKDPALAEAFKRGSGASGKNSVYPRLLADLRCYR
jgi:transposase